MGGFSSDNGFNSDTNDGGGLLSDLKSIGDLFVGIKTGLDASSVDKKRLEIQAAQQRADQELAAQNTAASFAQNQSLISILKVVAVGVAGISLGYIFFKLIKGR